MISRVRRILRHVREIAAELDYAQRRLLEIRTGIPLTPETERALVRSEIARLEALYPGRTPALNRPATANRIRTNAGLPRPRREGERRRVASSAHAPARA